MLELRPYVRGINLDFQTRCAHYNSPLDIIAIKMKCCGLHYACKACHDALADNALQCRRAANGINRQCFAVLAERS
jgi:uncharacterized CHY-type Zn-finger protein